MSTDWGTDLSEYDAVLYVQAAPFPQEIECPECNETFQTLIDGEEIGGGDCHECGAWLRYIHDRSRLPENRDDGDGDETEQAGIDGWSA